MKNIYSIESYGTYGKFKMEINAETGGDIDLERFYC